LYTRFAKVKFYQQILYITRVLNRKSIESCLD
jgi:hypothetical protein